MRATLIHNPAAGDGQPSGARLKRMLADAGLQVRYRSRKGDWKKALRDEAELVIAAGGDGTVAKVALALSGSSTPLAILPLGTANNISRALGIGGEVGELVEGWRKGRPQPLDIGVISAAWGETRFVESAGGGVFGRLIDAAADEVEKPRGLTGAVGDRALHLLRRLLEQATPRRWRLSLDGEDLSGDYVGVEALNIRFIGPKVPLAPDADPGDGMLDVVLIGRRERDELIAYLDGRMAYAAAEMPRLTARRGHRLHLVPPPSEPLHAGDSLLEPPADYDPPDGAANYDILLRPKALLVYR
ncbi:MAG TPA: diacylglycerol kinase family protein [Candidatus Limnocylindrales bacterium]